MRMKFAQLVVSFAVLFISRLAKGKPHFHVTSILIEPYLMEDHKHVNTSGPMRYKGYIVDLMDRLAERVGFEYSLSLVADESYGYEQSDGTWNGLIGELRKGTADIAAAPLYVTDERAEVVHFTQPFMHVQATLLVHKRRLHAISSLALTSAHDLLQQHVFMYGTLYTGVIRHAFTHSNSSMAKYMWQAMRVNPANVFTRTNMEGIDRVRHENYVFILPSTIGEYVALQVPCDLVTIDRFLMNRHFSLALSNKHALMTADLNKGIESLRQAGTLDKLYNKWWRRNSMCAESSKSSSMTSPNHSNHASSHSLLVISTLVLLHYS